MRRKYNVFFVNNINFQLLMALIVSRMLGLRKEDTILYIKSPVGDARNIEEIEKHFTLCENIADEYGTAYFFTTVFPDYDVFRKLKCEKKILIYEGLTTYYTEYWASLYKSWSVEEFDEVLVPSVELVENPSATKYVKLDCASWFKNPQNLKSFAEDANKVFRYTPHLDEIEQKNKTVIFDRDFERFNPRILKHTSHRLITVFCAAAYNFETLVKLHPFEHQNYYFDYFSFDTIKNKMPNELIYINMLQNNEPVMETARTYIIYNSSSAVNCYSLFGDNNFSIICIGDLLNRYGVGIENTLVSYKHTREVLLKLHQYSNIDIYFPKNLEDIFEAVKK